MERNVCCGGGNGEWQLKVGWVRPAFYVFAFSLLCFLLPALDKRVARSSFPSICTLRFFPVKRRFAIFSWRSSLYRYSPPPLLAFSKVTGSVAVCSLFTRWRRRIWSFEIQRGATLCFCWFLSRYCLIISPVDVWTSLHKWNWYEDAVDVLIS